LTVPEPARFDHQPKLYRSDWEDPSRVGTKFGDKAMRVE